jgi:hypothetical protein
MAIPRCGLSIPAPQASMMLTQSIEQLEAHAVRASKPYSSGSEFTVLLLDGRFTLAIFQIAVER